MTTGRYRTNAFDISASGSSAYRSSFLSRAAASGDPPPHLIGRRQVVSSRLQMRMVHSHSSKLAHRCYRSAADEYEARGYPRSRRMPVLPQDCNYPAGGVAQDCRRGLTMGCLAIQQWVWSAHVHRPKGGVAMPGSDLFPLFLSLPC